MANSGISNTVSLQTSLNVDPYYDDFNESKNFYRLLFRPGLAVQARELTQIQSLLQNQVDRFAEHVFKEGSVVRGCELNYDNFVPFVRIRDSQANGSSVDVASFLNTEITGASSNVKAIVIDTKVGSEANTPGTKTLYVKYTSGGTTANNTTFSLGEKLNANTGVTANIISSSAFGFGSRMTLGDGVVFAKDHFIRTPSQSIIVGEYNSNTATFRVGYNMTESITTSNTDTTLLDPAQGAYNYTAPGANRLTITPTIAKYSTANSSIPNFIEIARVRNGFLQTIGNEPNYNAIGDFLANRTFEESGDYIVDGNFIKIREHLKSSNNDGVFTSAQGGNTNQISVEVTPGVGFVKGYRYKNITTQHVPVPKGIDTAQKDDLLASANYGNFITVREVSGSFDINGHDTVKLMDTTQRSISNNALSAVSSVGNQLGTARVRSLEHLTGNKGDPNCTYKLYLYDIKMTANTFANVRGIFHDAASGPNGKADTVLTSGNTVITDSTFNRSIFELPAKDIKTLRDSSGTVDTDYTFNKSFDVTLSTAGQFTLATGASDETYPTGTGTLSSTQKQDRFYLTLTQAANTTQCTGLLSTANNSNAVTGTSTNFASGFNVGEKLKIDGYANLVTISAITNETNLSILETTGRIQNKSFHKAIAAGTVINLSGKGANTGADRTVTVSSTTSAAFDIKEELRSTATAVVQTELTKANGQEKDKELKSNRLVQIRIANNVSGNTGPYDLGFSDVFKLNSVRKKSTTFTGTTQGTDVTDQFIIDTGQRDGLYEHGQLQKLGSSTLSLTSADFLLVDFDFFQHSTSQGTGYFSVDSYPIDEANTANTTAITTQEIPIYISPTTGREYDLRNHIDTRPKLTDSATDTTAIGSMTTNPSVRTTILESSGGLHFPAPNENYDVDLQVYLGRKDLIVIDRYGNARNIKGDASENPSFPIPQNIDAMVLGLINITPFPSLPYNTAKTFKRDDQRISMRSTAVKRFTMKDILGLEQRIENLEYYTSLNLLEQTAKNFSIKDSAGLDRFKNGFVVDNFTGHRVGDVRNVDYYVSIDELKNEARPPFFMNNIQLDLNTANSSSVSVKSKDLVIRLSSNSAFQTGETVTIGSINGTIRNIVGVYSSGNDNALNVSKLYLENMSGDLVSTSGTVTGGSSGVSASYTVPALTANNTTSPGLGMRPAGKLVTLPYTHDIMIDQPNATTSRNAAGLFFNYNGSLSLDPDTVVWNDLTQGPEININFDGNADAWIALQEILGRQLGRSWNTAWQSWRRVNGSFTRSGNAFRWQETRDGLQTVFVPGQQQIGSMDVVQQVDIVPFIKSQEIKVSATGLKPLTTHFAFFDGEDVSSFCSLANTSFGNTSNEGAALTTSANGSINMLFRIPNEPSLRFRAGPALRFRLSDSVNNSDQVGLVTSAAESSFSGQGINTTRSNVTVSTRTVQVQRNSVNQIRNRFRPIPRPDPIAQSFAIRTELFGNELITQDIDSPGAFLTKVDLFFATKSSTHPVDIEIRLLDVEAGLPTDEVVPFSQVQLQPSEINLSTNASVPTSVFFDTPIYLSVGNEYCIVVRPHPLNTDCRVFTGRLGEDDLITGNRVTSQPHTGLLFLSANDRTWSAQQVEDLKFKMYFANFGTNQTGTAVMKNRNYEFFNVSNTSAVPTDFTEAIHGETVLTYSSLSNSQPVVGANVQGATSGATGTVASQNTSSNQFSIKNVSSAKFANGEFIRFRTGSPSTGTLIGNTGALTGVATPTATIYMYDDFSQSNTRLLTLDNSTGTFKTGTELRTQKNDITFNLDSMSDINSDVHFLQNSQLALPGTTISASGKMAASASAIDTTASTFNINEDTRLGSRKFILSRTHEVNKVSSAKSVDITYTMTNGIDKRISPAIDNQLGNFCAIENLVNNDSTSETGVSGGNATAKYITRTVELADGQDAEDIRVVLAAYKPQQASIKVYYKILNADDSDVMELDRSYVEMSQNTVSTVYSSNENIDDFIDYEFNIPSGQLSGSGGVVQYTNSQNITFSGFKKFKIKVALLTSDPSNPPRIRDFRAIALQV